eukprot:9479072-Alexandrium_andersonii.AAC.1
MPEGRVAPGTRPGCPQRQTAATFPEWRCLPCGQHNPSWRLERTAPCPPCPEEEPGRGPPGS